MFFLSDQSVEEPFWKHGALVLSLVILIFLILGLLIMIKMKDCISNCKPNESNSMSSQKEKEEEKEEEHIYHTIEELEAEQMYDIPLQVVNRPPTL